MTNGILIGVILAAAVGLAVLALARRSQPEKGGVSEQWLAQHRADSRDPM